MSVAKTRWNSRAAVAGTMWCADASNIFAFRCAKGACVSRARRESVNGPLLDSSRRIWKKSLFGCARKKRSSKGCDPNISRTQQFAHADELLVRAEATASVEKISAVVQKWLKERFAERLSERVSFWADKTGLHPKKVSISNAKKQWGSCTRQGAIRLSWRLICLPESALDYVIVHELVHLRHFDHSSAFWNDVQTIYPETPSVRRYLKTVRATDLF